MGRIDMFDLCRFPAIQQALRRDDNTAAIAFIVDSDRSCVVGIDRIFGRVVIEAEFHDGKLAENDNFFKESSNMGAKTL